MAQPQNAFDAYAANGKSMFDFWVSFFPTAPMFGVQWRFAEFAMGATSVKLKTGEVSEKPVSEAVVESTDVVVDDVTVLDAEAVEGSPEVVAPEAETAEDCVVEATLEPSKPVLLDARPELIDPLTKIKGVGPGLETQLHDLGIYTFEQLADLNDAQLEWLDENLKTVKGRCIRDDWAGQAKALTG